MWGGSFYLITVFLFHLTFFIFVPRTHVPGSGDMGPISAWILIGLYWLLQFIPLSVLSMAAILFPAIRDALNAWASDAIKFWAGNATTFWAFILYIFYATLVYALIGISVSKTIEFVKNAKGKPK